MLDALISQAVLKCFAIIFVIGMACIFVVSARDAAISYRLQQSGTTVEAKIIDRYRKYGRTVTAFIVYYFVDTYSRAYERTVQVGSYRDWTERTTVQVRFLPNNPYISRILSENSGYVGNVIFAVISIATLFGVGYFFGLLAVPILMIVWLVVFYSNLWLLARRRLRTA